MLDVLFTFILGTTSGGGGSIVTWAPGYTVTTVTTGILNIVMTVDTNGNRQSVAITVPSE